MLSPAIPAQRPLPGRRWPAILLLAVLFCSIHAHSCSAQSITVTETAKLQFGTLLKPSSGTETYTISTSGATSGTGTRLYGTTSRGSYLIKCSASCGASWTMDIQNINSGNANLTIDQFTGTWGQPPYPVIPSFPMSGLPPAGGSGATLRLGATATYNSSIPVGPLTPSFDIVITVP